MCSSSGAATSVMTWHKRWFDKIGDAARDLCIVFADVRFVLPKWVDPD